MGTRAVLMISTVTVTRDAHVWYSTMSTAPPEGKHGLLDREMVGCSSGYGFVPPRWTKLWSLRKVTWPP